MNDEFITIAEAVRLTGQSDVDLMRLLKDRMESGGLDIESITRKEQRGSRMMYLISKAFLLRELDMTQNPQEDVPQEEVAKESAPEQQAPYNNKLSTGQVSPDVLLVAKDEMIATLQKIVETKDKQMDDLSKKIDELIERDRETNFLLRGLQEKIFALEGPKRDKSPKEHREETVKTEKSKK